MTRTLVMRTASRLGLEPRVAYCVVAAAGVAGCGGRTPDTDVDVEADEPSVSAQSVINGTDDRRDVYAHPNAGFRELAKESVVALMNAADVDARDPKNVKFRGPKLGAFMDLCPDQRFRSDPTAAFCSGTLIDKDLVLTAAHCVAGDSCAEARFVFNYYRTDVDSLRRVTTDDVFRCKRVVALRRHGDGADFAVVRLDRPATPRFTPARVATEAETRGVARGTPVGLVGCPDGTPMKIDLGGRVQDARASARDYFVATTDSFAGSSGAGVFLRSNRALVGLLVRGDMDYVLRGGCSVVNVCTPETCIGEESTYARRAIDAFCRVRPDNPRLCP